MKMTSTTVSHVAASARGVIVVCFTEWKGEQPVAAHLQVGARYLVIDANGPPIVRFRGDSPADAWHFLDSKGHEFVEVHEQALAKAYLQQAFKGRASGKPGSGDAAGRVAIIDRAGVEKKRQFDHSWVVVSKSGPTAEDAGLTILFGAESFEKMLEPEEESPSIDHSPKRPRGPR
ncbi:hypothetical protein JH311_05135 [Xanthomonas campestris pv. campestris]|uniref:hypothetical protein n=2 Tax=Xanthomonas campestris TaxID=339 RepID=UPI00279C0F3B|nr:hypothetical protein JH311_05135 [Xanthomonas campestris pv. campestris]